jgi:hypothetical protein
MSTDYPGVPWVEASFHENRGKFRPEETMRYAGQHIAWSWDGMRILASDPDRQALDQKLRAAGIDPGRVVHDYVDELDTTSQL